MDQGNVGFMVGGKVLREVNGRKRDKAQGLTRIWTTLYDNLSGIITMR